MGIYISYRIPTENLQKSSSVMKDVAAAHSLHIQAKLEIESAESTILLNIIKREVYTLLREHTQLPLNATPAIVIIINIPLFSVMEIVTREMPVGS